MTSKTLLINPPFSSKVYSESKVKAVAPEYPPITLVTLAAPLIKAGIEVEILDLRISSNPEKELKRCLEKIFPDYVGISFTTPQFSSMQRTASIIKEYNKNIFIIGGGPHPSAEPISSIENSMLDVIAIGEGDFSIVEIVSKSNDIKSIKGICFRHGKETVCNERGGFIQNLDELPMPSWELGNIKKYKMPSNYRKKNPVGPMETSRGCPFGCVYCNKSIFGRTFRTKSPSRVIEEIKYMLNLGFKEIHFVDDTFSNDLERAKAICDEIIKNGMDFPWNLPNGIRVDRIDKELFEKMRKAGCYRVAFGIESGDQNILNSIGKFITLDKVRNAMKLAKEVGLETTGFFILALPKDTKGSMQKTIDFAKELDPDIAKFSICTPLPGTPQFIEWKSQNRIKTTNWDEYIFHKKGPKIFEHPNLDWQTIDEYYDRAYREFYLRPKYIIKRIFKGNLIEDFKVFISTKW